VSGNATRDAAALTPARFSPSVITSNPAGQEAPHMEPPLTRVRHEVIDSDDLPVHQWRVTQLTRLGIP
jgi:hypothetical protein